MHFCSFIITGNEVGTRDSARGMAVRGGRHCYTSRAKIQQSRVRRWQQGHCRVEGQRWTDDVSCPGESEHGKLSLTSPLLPPVQLHHPTENTAFRMLISLHYLSSLSIRYCILSELEWSHTLNVCEF